MRGRGMRIIMPGVAAAALFGLAGALQGCEDDADFEDAAEETGEAMEDAAEDLDEGMDDLEDDIDDGLDDIDDSTGGG